MNKLTSSFIEIVQPSAHTGNFEIFSTPWFRQHWPKIFLDRLSSMLASVEGRIMDASVLNKIMLDTWEIINQSKINKELPTWIYPKLTAVSVDRWLLQIVNDHDELDIKTIDITLDGGV